MRTVLKNKMSRAQNSSFKKLLFVLTAFFGVCFLIFVVATAFYKTGFLFSAAITFGVTFYHFAMRLAVGYSVEKIFAKNINYNCKWFAPKKFEHRIYKKLKVRKWKGKVPTFNPEQFDVEKHTLDEIIRSMCIAEIVHEVIFLLSFLPIFLAIPFGDFWIFFITSIISTNFDLVFIILQRYNRPRVINLLYRNK